MSVRDVAIQSYQKTDHGDAAERKQRVRAEDAAADPETPRGTMFILLVYAAVLAGLWGYTYLNLILRR